MTSDEYSSLMDFLATRFARMDARFDAIEARLDRLEARMGGLETRMGGLETRMGGLEGRQESLETRMGALEGRQDSLDTRLARSEVLWESMRHDLRLVAEGVVALGERVDRRLDGIQVQFDRFAVDFGTVQLDHGARLEALERWRRGQGGRG